MIVLVPNLADNIRWQFMKISYDLVIIVNYVDQHGC
jgi:hypothetical protein